MTPLAVRLDADPALATPFLWQLAASEPKLLSLGSRADWSLAVPDMLPIAAKIYFDGQGLSVAALGTRATLNGQPLDGIFRPLTLPARLRLGETAISLAAAAGPALGPAVGRAGYTDSETREMAFDDLYPLQNAEHSRGSFSPIESGSPTLIEFPAHLPATLKDRLQALATTRADPRTVARSAKPATGALPPAATPPKSSRPGGREPRRLGPWRSFQQASFAKRATVVLLPFVIGLFGWKAFHRAPRALAPRAIRSSASPSAFAAETNSAPLPLIDAPRVVPLDTPPAATSAVAAEPHKRANASSVPRQSVLTLQRRAVDAFANGNFAEAAGLYQRLAVESPDQAAYRIASRIADDKAKAQVQ